MSRWRYVLVAAIIMLAILSAGLGLRTVWAQTSTPLPTPAPAAELAGLRTITMSGDGEVDIQPDQALVQLGVQNDAQTAAAALTANSQQMQGLLTAVSQAGVANADVQTQQVQLAPRYNNPGPQGGTPELIGYTASNIVQVRVRDLTKLGQLLDATVKAGGNRIEGINFVISDMASATSRARAAAWSDALTKAQQLASLSGNNLGDVQTISESGGQVPRPVPLNAVAAPAAAVPIQPGTQTVSAQVQVTWLLRSGGPAIALPAATGTAAIATSAVSTSSVATSAVATSALATSAVSTPAATSAVATAMPGTATAGAAGAATPAATAAVSTVAPLATALPTP